MRVVFMGTPHFAEVILQSLINSKHEIVGVVTRPDAVRGRGKSLVSSPVKVLALSHEIPVLECSSFKSDEAMSALEDFRPDVICVAAFGALLPKSVLELPRLGCLNVHGSLLPRWRGAAPVERAILAGDSETGIGIMRMEEGLDTGDTCATRKVPVDAKSASLLSDELARVGGTTLVEVLDVLTSGNQLSWLPQSDRTVTYAHKIEKGELDIDPSLDRTQAYRHIQASSDNHPARCVVAQKPLTVLKAALPCDAHVPDLSAGEVAFQAKRLFLGCADGVLELVRVKPDGKKEMEAKAFAAGIQGIKQGGITWGGYHG